NDMRCLRDLVLTDPGDDKHRIERTKGGLLKDCYHWILNDPAYRQWLSGDESGLLWIKGDSGKGKTMIVIGLVEELSKKIAKPRRGRSSILSYFLCQGTDSRLNNAAAVLRGVIYLLASQQLSLIHHLRAKYDNHGGPRLFDNPDAFYILSGVFLNMLRDLNMPVAYLMIDALDECEGNLYQLLDLIAQTTTIPSSKIKWIVSSRNRNEIEQHLVVMRSGWFQQNFPRVMGCRQCSVESTRGSSER
ncbi:hypothetical protein BO71DRAFT_336935, partial [Aspergillus ellipticus CBS 707.79]